MRDQILSDFLKVLAARETSPGGGVTAALHVAQAAALVARCARLTDEREVVAEAEALSMHALRLAEKDAHAVTTVSRARPGDQRAVLDARRGACVPPADVIAAAAVVLDLAERVPPDPQVAADLAAAAEAARAAAATARVGIEVHLAGLPADEALRETVAGVAALCERADRVTSAVREAVGAGHLG
jgi:formiminotetrahydrofolate cyclodeaminase